MLYNPSLMKFEAIYHKYDLKKEVDVRALFPAVPSGQQMKGWWYQDTSMEI